MSGYDIRHRINSEIAAAMTAATGEEWNWGGSLTGRSFYANIDNNCATCDYDNCPDKDNKDECSEPTVTLRVADHDSNGSYDAGEVINERLFESEYTLHGLGLELLPEDATQEEIDADSDKRRALAAEYNGEWSDNSDCMRTFDHEACKAAYVEAAKRLCAAVKG